MREKISNLYSEVLDYSGKPTNAQLESLKVLEDKLTNAKSKMSIWKSKIEKLNPELEKAKFGKNSSKTFEEYKLSNK